VIKERSSASLLSSDLRPLWGASVAPRGGDMTNPTVGLQPDDLQRVMDQFGVSEEQVRRDHAISHILAALSRSHREQLIFFGGTALSRTFLLDGRLSEDIDLIALINCDELAEILVRDIANALRQTHGRIV
jgi:hypothetical protein